jgi:glucosamine--fructose-6-phosphate aminotransferase (isomerizing)
MDKQYLEIKEIPERALDFWKNSKDFILPLKVPYIGMGSSYFAPLSFKYLGIDIYPEIASEYFNYLKGNKSVDAVILSQSGRSTEALWCAKLFEKYTAISNDIDSSLCINDNVNQVVEMLAGKEEFSSSNTYINTLLVLFKGFGFNAKPAIDLLFKNFATYEETGKKLAEEIFDLLKSKSIHGIYILGNGPNIGTAYQAALILSESTKINFTGLPMAQYDHGPKETAKDSIVIVINSKGSNYERANKLQQKIKDAGANVFEIEEPEVSENFSIINNIVIFNFLAYYLARHFNIQNTFTVGGKVTEVE